ncbi:uncharacterized protein LOC118784194 isoform X1 [Megalops cyprinoides]|uniref:uncharacterized protein LOC118784194 isoform X1 n=1 Tax=Megalops cyprinoides TaxID=118141 RepID=UPI0018648805|nr:uncharacterized protein LOC118784194 isoform X1 [Megalops cyprinoides]
MYSDASTVTVLDLIKPNISVSTHHPETQISCEAPSPITGAVFHLYDTRSKNIIKESHAGAGERSVTFVVPHDPDPNLRYCCSYQYRTINSVMSDYAGPKEHPVTDLIKPNISVSTHDTETHIHCEAPPSITGAVFHLYDTRSESHVKEKQAGAGESAVTFTVPHEPNLKYCCSYQYTRLNSAKSDCVGPKGPSDTGISGWLPIVGGVSAACVILLGATALCLCWRHKKHRSNRQPITPSNDPAEASYSVASKEEHNKDPTLSDVTYSSINHMAPQCSYPAPSQDSVVYSSLKTD